LKQPSKKPPKQPAKKPAPKLKKVIDTLKKKGASEVRVIKAADVVVDERVRLKCQIPICDSYGKNLMCPPYLPSVMDFRDALARYDRALLVQLSVPLHKKTKGKTKAVFDPARVLHELINLGERLCFEAGFRFATGLIGGCCRLCEVCIVMEPEGHCRHPFRARPSMEAMGIDVIGTLENAGLPLLRFPVQEKVTWTGLILL
jgi:predicted metal-binding protein